MTASATIPRSVLVTTGLVLAGALAVAMWAWARWGEGVFFDVTIGGLSTCL